MTMTTIGNTHGFRFREWDICDDARTLRREVSELLKTYPKEERYALVDQTKRALNSIVLNIAEGTNKTTDKDTRIYINRAHCSLDEVVASLDCALDDGYILPKQHGELLEKASTLARRLRKFSDHLKVPSSSSS